MPPKGYAFTGVLSLLTLVLTAAAGGGKEIDSLHSRNHESPQVFTTSGNDIVKVTITAAMILNQYQTISS